MPDEAIMIKQLQEWGTDDPRIHALLLTSSRVRPSARTDLFSDYDVVVITNALDDFLRAEAWMQHFGTILVRFNDTVLWPHFNLSSHMRLVLYDTGLKIDLSVTTSYGKLPAHQNAMTEGLKSDVCSRIMGDEFAAPK